MPMVPMAPIGKATLANGDRFTNGTIGEDALKIAISLCILDMCGFLGYVYVY